MPDSEQEQDDMMRLDRSVGGVRKPYKELESSFIMIDTALELD